MSARRPGSTEIQAALAAAEQLRADANDPQHIGLVLRYFFERSQALEALLQVTDRYLRFGMPEHELSQMRLLRGRLREPQLAADDSDEVDSTLPI